MGRSNDGAFDSMQIFSGTSMAVPHVVGLASILWQKDTEKTPEFIRQLICATARECGDAKTYGYGLIDCEYALEKYDEFAQHYVEGSANALDDAVPENREDISTDEDVRNLYGSWKEVEHKGFVSKNMGNGDDPKVLYPGAQIFCGDIKRYEQI